MLTVALDVSPLVSAHRYRGVGFYTKNLAAALHKLEGSGFRLTLADKTPPTVPADLVHYPYFDLFYRTLHPNRKIKTIVTVHDVIPLLFPRHYPPGIKGQINYVFQKLALGKSAAVITDSESSKKDIGRFLRYPADKIRVVYLAPAPHFKKLPITNYQLPSIRKKYNLPKRFILYVGDVNYHKNVVSLVEACRQIATPLVLVGKAAVATDFDRNHPENRPLVELQKMIAHNPAVRALGFVPDLDLVALYNLAAVYCQPSLYEGFGLNVLEAMACGCPVVSTRCGSLEEIGGRAVFFADGSDSARLAQALNPVLSKPPLRAKLVTAGLSRAAGFSWEKTARQTLAVYEHLYSTTQ